MIGPHLAAADIISGVIELAKLGLVGLIAGLYTSYRAKRDFVSQKWWERKADAYSLIVEALWNYSETSKVEAAQFFKNAKYDNKYLEEIHARSMKCSQDLRKAASIGAFIISERASHILNDFHGRRDAIHEDNWPDQIEFDCDEAPKCLVAIRQEAKNDLGVGP